MSEPQPEIEITTIVTVRDGFGTETVIEETDRTPIQEDSMVSLREQIAGMYGMNFVKMRSRIDLNFK